MRAALKKLFRYTQLCLPWIEGYRRNWPVRNAEAFIEAGRLYSKEESQGILRDYREIFVDTQLGIAGICNLEDIAKYVIGKGLKGAFVECGTWRGGAIAYWARSFTRNGGVYSKNSLYGFDSFEGMPRMTKEDGEEGSRWLYGKSIDQIEERLLDGALISTGANVACEEWCKKLVEASGYDKDSIHIIKGWFQDTLPIHKQEIGPIAVLRLDADFYEATKFCLDTLYDNVMSGGVVIIDDYGWFDGCRQAVNEFLRRKQIGVPLFQVDVGIRYFLKP
jgi:O-methyltransferase